VTTPRRALREVAEADVLDLAPRLLLLTLLLNPGLRWQERSAVLLLASAGLLGAALARSALLWLALAAAAAWRALHAWPHADNHDFLSLWACLALAVSLPAPDPRAALGRNARLLLGLVFGFATLWKAVLSPDFADGTFFRVTLLTDGRFRDLALLAGGMSEALFEENARRLDAFAGGFAGVPWTGLVEPPALRRLAALLSAGTLLGEGLLALAFLWPRARGVPVGLSRLRDPALLAFCALTYLVAPVGGFGRLLCALGLAQCEAGRRVRLLYLGAWLWVLFHETVPWTHALVR
jgi:hypothetical protein